MKKVIGGTGKSSKTPQKVIGGTGRVIHSGKRRFGPAGLISPGFIKGPKSYA
jgi:hypothetical protein